MSPSPAPLRPAPSPSILSQINDAKSQISRGQQLLFITVGVGVLTLGAGITMIQLPWQQKRQQLASGYSEEKKRSELLVAIQQQKADLKETEGKLLLQGGATGLTGQISQLANQSGLQIDSVTPQPEVVVEPYTRFQIEILATGNLANALRFLRGVEEHRPLLWVEQMDMGDPPGEAAAAAFTTYEEKQGAFQQPTDQKKIRFMIGAVSRQKVAR